MRIYEVTTARPSRATLVALWVLPFLFCLRVTGQLLAGIAAPSFLPPFEEWDSGALPYAVLLTLQALVLLVQARVAWDLSRTRGFFARPRPRAGKVLTCFAWVYFGVMVGRYVLTMALFPEMRWLGHAIPITFHFVLAGWVWTYARYLGEGAPELRESRLDFHDATAEAGR